MPFAPLKKIGPISNVSQHFIGSIGFDESFKHSKAVTPDNTNIQPLSGVGGYDQHTEISRLKKQNLDLQDQLRQKDMEISLKDNLIKGKDTQIHQLQTSSKSDKSSREAKLQSQVDELESFLKTTHQN